MADSTELVGGGPVTGGYKNKLENGQQKDYICLNEKARGETRVRPMRYNYLHTWGIMTSINNKIAETYAVNPTFYTSTFCVGCGAHFPVEEFTWEGGTDKVGS